MNAEELKQKTKQFAIDCALMTSVLTRSDINRTYAIQLIRSSASVAANYRAVRRAKSRADFINKLKIVEEELDESLLWIELLAAFNKLQRAKFAKLYKEGEELLKIIVATIISSRK